MTKTVNCTLFSKLTRDYDSGEPLIILENLPFYKNATLSPDQLRVLAKKLMTIADEATKGDAGEFQRGEMELYYSVSDFENTETFADSDDDAEDDA